ncbi:hypothetical protein E2C01_094762 [Portunus trituberculatus]|uniref:Uncharacterized protein n=1 Tax=Portunus trituberculatus TaxID=210409 RepID=A0A5B7JY29_PORTR|nr:hypothetical protein [Portunus trituberculatus]
MYQYQNFGRFRYRYHLIGPIPILLLLLVITALDTRMSWWTASVIRWEALFWRMLQVLLRTFVK